MAKGRDRDRGRKPQWRRIVARQKSSGMSIRAFGGLITTTSTAERPTRCTTVPRLRTCRHVSSPGQLGQRRRLARRRVLRSVGLTARGCGWSSSITLGASTCRSSSSQRLEAVGGGDRWRKGCALALACGRLLVLFAPPSCRSACHNRPRIGQLSPCRAADDVPLAARKTDGPAQRLVVFLWQYAEKYCTGLRVSPPSQIRVPRYPLDRS